MPGESSKQPLSLGRRRLSGSGAWTADLLQAGKAATFAVPQVGPAAPGSCRSAAAAPSFPGPRTTSYFWCGCCKGNQTGGVFQFSSSRTGAAWAAHRHDFQTPKASCSVGALPRRSSPCLAFLRPAGFNLLLANSSCSSNSNSTLQLFLLPARELNGFSLQGQAVSQLQWLCRTFGHEISNGTIIRLLPRPPIPGGGVWQGVQGPEHNCHVSKD